VVHRPLAAVFPVFLVSSLFHDYHISVGVGFFAPVFLVLFAGIGGILIDVFCWTTNCSHVNLLQQLWSITWQIIGECGSVLYL